MDFFEQQERARKKSGVLVLLFCLAVAAIILAVYGAIMAFVGLRLGLGFWHPRALLWVGGGVVGVVTYGSLSKLAELRGGGAVVARNLDGTLIDPRTTDPLERRLL